MNVNRIYVRITEFVEIYMVFIIVNVVMDGRVFYVLMVRLCLRSIYIIGIWKLGVKKNEL